MNIQKLIAVAAATLITCAGIAELRAWTDATVANAAPPPVRAEQITTLPAITVRPTREQIAIARQHRGMAAVHETAGSAAEASGLDMPYYSFGARPASFGK